jgi:hypothetical protein
MHVNTVRTFTPRHSSHLLLQPAFSPNTLYWVALTPRTPLAVSAGGFNGVLWSGLNVSSGLLPKAVSSDANLFTARSLRSQRSAGDATFSANTAAAVTFLASVSKGSFDCSVVSRALPSKFAARTSFTEHKLGYGHSGQYAIHQLGPAGHVDSLWPAGVATLQILFPAAFWHLFCCRDGRHHSILPHALPLHVQIIGTQFAVVPPSCVLEEWTYTVSCPCPIFHLLVCLQTRCLQAPL